MYNNQQIVWLLTHSSCQPRHTVWGILREEGGVNFPRKFYFHS